MDMAGAVLHWDFENAPTPRGVSVGRVFGEMRTLIHKRFGPLLGAFAYADPAALPQARKIELQAAGLDLIDCSRAAGKTNTVDFRIVSRALQDLARPMGPNGTRTAAVVVTGDGDFAYTISVLRNVCVPTMLIFDHDRQSTVNSLMLEIADFVEPLSFGGDEEEEEDATDEALETGSGGGCGAPGPPIHDGGGAWQVAGPSHNPSAQSRAERAFLHALHLAPPADDEGYRAATSVGLLFHRLRRSPEPTKALRQGAYRKVRDSFVARSIVTVKNGQKIPLIKLTTPSPSGASASA
jgi:hypothetical protein